MSKFRAMLAGSPRFMGATDQVHMATMEFADHSRGVNIPGNPKSRSRRVQELVEQLWSITWNPVYSSEYTIEGKVSCSAEASDLDANRDVRPRNQCPCCDNFFQKKDLIRTITMGQGEDTEIGGWIFRCPNMECRAHITIFND